jgi:hypothetical protein
MADSTYAVATRTEPDTREARWNAERRQRRALRHDLLWCFSNRSVHAAMQLVNDGSPPHFGAAGVAAAHITCQTALIHSDVVRSGRSLRPREASAFRVLGDLAVRGQLSEEDAVGAIEAGIDGNLDALRTRSRGAPFSPRTRAAVQRELESEACAFIEEATKELRLGMAGELRGTEDKAGVLLRLLDGRLADDELGAAASRVGLDASREYGLVLLVHTAGCTEPTEAAAQDAEGVIFEAVDLGLTDSQPLCRRLIFPVITHGRWLEARTNLHDIATRYGVLAIAPVAAPRLGALAATCRELERDLARVVKGCGYTKGIIDPAGVGPVCAAEGTSPAPVEEWAGDAALVAAFA